MKPQFEQGVYDPRTGRSYKLKTGFPGEERRSLRLVKMRIWLDRRGINVLVAVILILVLVLKRWILKG